MYLRWMCKSYHWELTLHFSNYLVTYIPFVGSAKKGFFDIMMMSIIINKCIFTYTVGIRDSNL